MINIWPAKRIEDISEKVGMGPFGSSIKVETFVSEGVPIISGQHLHGFKLDDSVGYNYITAQHAEKLKGAIVHRGDIVFTHAGNIGQVAVITKDSQHENYVLSQRQFFLRCDPEKSDPEYIVAYFKSPEGRHKLLANTSQVGVPSISKPVTYLRSIEIPLPPLSEQRAIAHILGTLDDKIENNRKTAKTLEAMAQAIFQSWFVDFDPVRAKMAGESRESICQRLKLTPEILDLFPDRLVDSELGEIPDGWVLNPISEIIEFNPAMPIKKNVAAPYLDMASLPTVGSWPADPIFRPYSSGMKFQNGDTLLARITPCLENGKTAYIQCLKDHSVGWGSTEFIVMRPKPPVPSAVAYLVARNNKFRAHAIQSMTGTSGRQRSQVHTISEFQVIQPDNANIWPYFGSVSVPIFNSIRSFARKNILLIKLRDTLLPKLISGEIRVPEAEHLIEEAAG